MPREAEEAAELEIGQLMVSPDGWAPPGMSEYWIRERKVGKVELSFNNAGEPCS